MYIPISMLSHESHSQFRTDLAKKTNAGSSPIFNILCKKVMIFNTLKNVVALQTLIFRIFVRPLVGGLKRIQTIVLRRFGAGGAIGIA